MVVWVRLRCCSRQLKQLKQFRVSADVLLCATPQFQCHISRILEVVVLAFFCFRGWRLRLHFCTEYLVSNQFLSQHAGIAAVPSLAWRSQSFAALLALQNPKYAVTVKTLEHKTAKKHETRKKHTKRADSDNQEVQSRGHSEGVCR